MNMRTHPDLSQTGQVYRPRFRKRPGIFSTPRITTVNTTIRPLITADDYQQCVELQRETWGADFRDCVPPAILMISQKMGGVASGAFDSTGALMGFVYGLTGWMDGELCHWSHMLAVAEPYRDRGIGRDLKVFQRSVLEPQNVVALYWTYDPLVARNAYLNLSKLGAHVTEYVPNMYGVDPGSATDRIIGSDRFVVRWPLQTDSRTVGKTGRRAGGQTGVPELAASTVLHCDETHSQAPVFEPKTDEATVRVEIPRDIQALKAVVPDVAREWRVATRKVFQSYLDTGYRVVDFKRRDDAGSSYYVLTRDASSGSAA